ncbi:hypothetical protein MCUN1_001305 [Malassezia cuniculi]|uniref:RRM domain-containing protein n=1 Tax=Malassezia cuniculi TaxID=948313 RepID=A0AAF0EST7_9BASI|nr:hypothetical protein MCUN1_001305 [Malassezia cuniculi]
MLPLPDAPGVSNAWPGSAAPGSVKREADTSKPPWLRLEGESDLANQLDETIDAFTRSAPLLPRPASQNQWVKSRDVSPSRSVFSETNGDGRKTPLLAPEHHRQRSHSSMSCGWPTAASRSISPDTSRRASDIGSLAANDSRTQLFVQNLPFSARWQDVKDLFRRAGTVLRADVQLLPDGRSSGAGTVLFATMEDAQRAIDMLHGYNWQGRVLSIHKEAGDADGQQQQVDASILSAGAWSGGGGGGGGAGGGPGAVTGLGGGMGPPMVGTQWPYAAHLMPAPGQPMNGANQLPFPGRVLFIGNLPFHCQWQDLKDLFRAAGNIQRADVALNADGRSRGFGTVLFASPADAQNAVRLFHGYEYGGRTLKVHFDRLAIFRPGPNSFPADPSEYTAAFSETHVPHTAKDTPETHGATHGAAVPTRVRSQGSHPGRITIPPAGIHSGVPNIGAPIAQGHLGHPGDVMTPTGAAFSYSMQPGPGFVPGQVPETPPLYHPHFLSHGGMGHIGSPILAGPMSPSGFTPIFNPVHNAPPMDYMSAVTAQPFAQTPLPYYDIGYMHPFTPLGPLPPTPHWSQPVRAPARAPVEDPTEAPAASAPGDNRPDELKNTTAELTNMIARMSVKGSARGSGSTHGLSPERNSAKLALTRLRETLTTPTPADRTRTSTKESDGDAASSATALP